MGNLSKTDAQEMARKMMIDGEPFDTIMEKTNLRLKDLKKIRRKEIDSHF
ncbi:hypothetical protein [Clostridium weizhouense]|uniref:Uncharacterized protein n=1 Tax=Clostridium weizhouense TaxID=2859781 RepID=A0ABS7ARI9_9CLOT|nr:hypothetical protein [Clostridium weizhouense]MBW6411277.1 hypothetical protein [Clostridium weizhouense]